jgi:hypothetical protein
MVISLSIGLEVKVRLIIKEDLYTMIFLLGEMEEGIQGGTLEGILGAISGGTLGGTLEGTLEGILGAILGAISGIFEAMVGEILGGTLGEVGLHRWGVGGMIEEVLIGGMKDGNVL